MNLSDIRRWKEMRRGASPPADRDDDLVDQIKSVPPHYSASLTVDLATTDHRVSVAVGSGINLVVGEIIDLLHSNTYCNVFAAGGAGSGAIALRVQTSDTTNSGDFTDPTSGLADLPQGISSGGIFYANSGLWASGSQSLSAPVNNAPLFCSGGFQTAQFICNGRYARLINVSGVFPNHLTAGFIHQKRTTASGVGSSHSPSATTFTINV